RKPLKRDPDPAFLGRRTAQARRRAAGRGRGSARIAGLRRTRCATRAPARNPAAGTGENRTGAGGATMNTPPFLIGATLAFWGWQSGNFVIGALLGIVLEGLRAFRLRIDLGVNEHSTIADLSTIGFVLLAVLLAANRGIARG